MESIAGFLKQTKLLGELTLDEIEAHILPRGSVRKFCKDSFLIRAGQRVDTVQLIISGRVNVVYYFADGSYSLAETELPARVLALDLIATKSGISPYYAVAAEDSAVFSFPAEVIMQPGTLPEADRQAVLSRLLLMLSHLHMQKEKHLMVLSKNSLRDRIMTYLSLQAQWKKSPSFTIPFSREEMAAYLCVNRSSLSHELSRMRQDGMIDFSKNSFTLLKYEPRMFTL